MQQIEVKFSAYKNLDGQQITIDPQANILLVCGDNETGKTSFITAILEAWGAKSLTPAPVTTGQNEGTVEYKIPDKNGNIVTIKQQIIVSKDGQKIVKFYAVGADGKAETQPTKIRELMGSVFPITGEQFMALCGTESGRRQVINDYIIPLMSDKERSELAEIDAKIDETKGTVFMQRRQENSRVDALQKIVDGYVLLEDDAKILKKGATAQKQLDELQDKLSSATAISFHNKDLNKKIAELKLFSEQLAQIKDLDTKIVNSHIDSIIGQISLLLKEEIDAVEMQAGVERGKVFLSRYNTLKATGDAHSKNLSDLEEAKKKASETEKELEKLRKRKKAIIANSKIPAGLEIQDGKITLNGFELSEAQISESTAKLVVAEILCMLSTAKITLMGNASAFGEARLQQLAKVAQKYGKYIILEQVTTDAKVVCVGVMAE